MNAVTYTQAERDLAATIRKVCDDRIPVIIACEDGNSAVLVSLEDYQAMEETAYLLRSPENARRLTESVAELESGGGIRGELAG